ncbi:class I SAM-dependent methyltransferase [Azospirillum brasilense]|uniref:class I SAM-dependent methyltransferase n=1 Tax=Azospirillum brasilense TaxID=192 RepID=UPI000CF0F9A0|nr:class I SAM-dependent methyltransferase [Azospirillum brasilense]MDW7630854.1 class I SAM-dependent methyltransferase [Azospirillum brasilense]
MDSNTKVSVELFHQKVNQLTDDQWKLFLTRSVSEHVVEDVVMPTFPPESFQSSIHGHSGVTSINEAFNFFLEVKNVANRVGSPFSPSRYLLDFGCGWGRIGRMFMKDIQPSRIYAVEPESANTIEARKNNYYTNIIQSEYKPPLVFGNGIFDYVVAWSVFSHLDEYLLRKWLEEFRRVLKPGGLVAITSQGRSFFDYVAQLKEIKERGEPLGHAWHETLVRHFVDLPSMKKQYDDGNFIHVQSHGSGNHYGEAFIPLGFAQRIAQEMKMELVEFMESGTKLPQSLIVLRAL